MESTQVAVTYDMIGGLDAAKTALREAITYPLKYPWLYSEGIAQEAGGQGTVAIPLCCACGRPRPSPWFPAA